MKTGVGELLAEVLGYYYFDRYHQNFLQNQEKHFQLAQLIIYLLCMQ